METLSSVATESRAYSATRLTLRGDGTLGPYTCEPMYHQQYLLKNPNGYRCHSASGVKVPR